MSRLRVVSIVAALLCTESLLASTSLPRFFEENQGQTGSEVRFLSRRAGHTVLLTAAGPVLRPSDGGPPIRMRFVGASVEAVFTGEHTLPGRSNYFIGRDPSRWCTDLPQYGRVRQAGIWPGVDVVYRDGPGGALEMDIEVAAGADASQIRWAFDGPVETADGLRLKTPGGELRLLVPAVYELEGDLRVPLAAEVVPAAGGFGLDVDRHPGRPLVVDPVLTYGSYLGGSDTDVGTAIAVDSDRNIVIGGYSASMDFPLVNPIQSTPQSNDIVIAKLDASGRSLLFSTYIGAESNENVLDIAIGPGNDVFASAYTSSSGFPTTPGAVQPNPGGLFDNAALRLSSSGDSLVYATYLGGIYSESSLYGGIAVDAAGNAYLTGETGSPDFPVKNAYQPTYLGADAYVTKLSPDGTSLIYSTFLGGATGLDTGTDVDVDAAGRALVTGFTNSGDFPMKNPLDPTFSRDAAYITVFDPTGQALDFSTYFGGSQQDLGIGVGWAGNGDILIAGDTYSPDFPLVNAYDTICSKPPNFSVDAFFARIDPRAPSLVFSTCLGGSYFDLGLSIGDDGTGSVYAFGRTGSPGFPSKCAIDSNPAINVPQFFVAKFAPDGSAQWVTPIGGPGVVTSGDATVDAGGTVFLAGACRGPDFPTTGAFQDTYAGGFSDAVIARIEDTPCGPATADFTATPVSGRPPLLVSFTSLSSGNILTHAWELGDGATSDAFRPTHVYGTTGVYDVSLTVSGPSGADTATRTGYIRVTLFDVDSVVAGQGPDQGSSNQVRILSDTGATMASFTAYGAGAWGTNVATGDVDGPDAEVLTGPGPGAVHGPHVRAFDTAGSPLAKVSFFAYGTLKFGAGVTASDLDGDVYADVLSAAGPGAVFGPHVRAFQYDAATLRPISKVNFFAYGSLKFGVRAAGGDLEGDGFGEILTGPGPSPAFGPQARAFDYDASQVTPVVTVNQFVFGQLRYGLEPAAGDVDTDGRAEGLYGPGPGPSLTARIRGFDLDGQMSQLPGLDQSVYPTLAYGLHPGAGDIDGDGQAEVLAGQGPDPSATSHIRGYRWNGGFLIPYAGADFEAFVGAAFGVTVAAGDLGP